MIPSPSSSTARSCVPPVTATKKAQDMPPDQSYFMPRSPYSTIPVTPSTSTPNPTRVPPNSPTTQLTAQPSLLAEQDSILRHFASRFPPPPTPFLPPTRGPAQGPPSPQISTSHRFPTSASTEGSNPCQHPMMSISSSPAKHTLHVQLPLSIKPEMITISANRGDKLRVFTDAWHMQQECESSRLDSCSPFPCSRSFTFSAWTGCSFLDHYEWQISFPPRDVDMSAVQAKLEQNGHLLIEIRRLARPG